MGCANKTFVKSFVEFTYVVNNLCVPPHQIMCYYTICLFICFDCVVSETFTSQRMSKFLEPRVGL